MKSEKNREEDPKGDEEKEKGEEGKGPTSPLHRVAASSVREKKAAAH